MDRNTANRIVECWNNYDEVKALNAEMVGLLDDVLTEWHSKPRNFEKKEPPYMDKIRVVLEKAKAL